MSRSKTAVKKFKDGFNCAQSVLYSFTDKLEISADLALKLGTGFGAGMGRKQEVCGAVTGAILVLNLLYGRGEKENRQAQETNYAKVREFCEQFEKKHETVICSKLLDGCDLTTDAGQKQFSSQKMINQCYEYVDDAVRILEQIT
jgi:C_GCAxxG_C_C family probable redox protein